MKWLSLCFGLLFSLSLALEAAEITIEPIALTGDPAPGLGTGVVFEEFLFGFPYDFDHGGTLLFKTTIDGPGIDPSNDQVLWYFDGEQLTIVARSGESVPEVGSDAVIEEIVTSGANGPQSAGRIGTFQTKILGQSGESRTGDGHFVWSVSDGQRRLVLRPGDRAPGLLSGYNFSFSQPLLSSAGSLDVVAIASSIRPNGLRERRAGFWRADLSEFGDLAPLALPGQPVSATSYRVADEFFWFGEHAEARPREAFLDAELVGPEVDRFSNEAIVLVTPTGLSEVLREGSPIPGPRGDEILGGGAGIAQFSSLNGSSNGGLVLRARIGFDERNQGIVVHRQGSASVVARLDDPMPGALGEFWFFLLGMVLPDDSVVFAASSGLERSVVWRDRDGDPSSGPRPTYVSRTPLLGAHDQFVATIFVRVFAFLDDGSSLVRSWMISDQVDFAEGLLKVGPHGDAVPLVISGQPLVASSGSFVPPGAVLPPTVERFEVIGIDSDGSASVAIEFDDGRQGLFAIRTESDAVFVSGFETGTLSRWTAVGFAEAE